MEWNYNTHDKELLAVFIAFKRWCNYLEGSTHPVDTVTDHKNLEYFTTTKKLTQCQVRWSEFLSQFNLKIWFRPGWLGAKPDALTCQWDVYGGRMMECNVQPIFSSQQVTDLQLLVRTGMLEEPDMVAMEIMDTNQLMSNIKEATEGNPLMVSILQKSDKT